MLRISNPAHYNLRMVAAAILAAGRSVRWAIQGAAETPDGRPLTRTARHLSTGGVDAPLVVARSDDDLLRSEVESAGARLVINPDADEGGQLSSLLAGCARPTGPGARVDGRSGRCADDMPETVAKLIAVFNDSHGSIIRARYQGRNGHPVIFSRVLFDQLRHAPRKPEQGHSPGARARYCQRGRRRSRRNRRHRYTGGLRQARAMMFTASASPRLRRLRRGPANENRGLEVRGNIDMKRLLSVIGAAGIAAAAFTYSNILAQSSQAARRRRRTSGRPTGTTRRACATRR